MFGERWRSHASATCIGGSLQGRCYCVERRRLQWGESSEREERHIGYALPGEVVDEGIVAPVREVVEVLHADYLRDGLGLYQLRRSDVTQTEMTNQSLFLSSASTVRGSSMDPSVGPALLLL